LHAAKSFTGLHKPYNGCLVKKPKGKFAVSRKKVLKKAPVMSQLVRSSPNFQGSFAAPH
jgi:hypothetical protein